MRTSRITGAAWSASILALALGVAPVEAAFLNVNVVDDSIDVVPGDGVCADGFGGCSLRAAIMEANALPGSNTIIVPAGTFVLDVVGSAEGAATTGDLDITGDLVIAGAGAGLTIIDAALLDDRVIEVIGSETNVVIAGVTVRNGKWAPGAGLGLSGGGLGGISPIAGGGGIANRGVLKLDGVVVEDNAALQSNGGGILNRNGVLFLENSEVRDNRAEGDDVVGGNGGGIASNGVLWMVGSSVVGNVAQGGRSGAASNGRGGGVWSDGFVTATSGVIRQNRAAGTSTQSHGGGVYHAAGSISFHGCEISSNEADGVGGGVATPIAVLGLTDCRLEWNVGVRGGAIYNGAGPTDCVRGDLNLNNSIVAGGAICQESGRLTVIDSDFFANEAFSGDGGAIYHAGALLYVDGCTMTSNSADGDGGGVFADGDASIDASCLIENFCDGDGAGVSFIGGLLLVDGTELSGGVAQGGGGGLSHRGDWATISNCTIDDNVAIDLGGGGIRALSGLDVSTSSVRANFSSDCGGGLYADDAQVYLTTVNVDDNVSLGEGGGAFVDDDYAEITGSTFNGNYSNGSAGGLSLQDVSSVVTDTVVADNRCNGDGGGVWIGSLSHVFTNVSVTDNLAINGVGGGIYHADELLELHGSAVSRNGATDCAGGIYTGRDLYLFDTEVNDNFARDGAGIFASGNITSLTGSEVNRNFASNGDGGGIHTEGTFFGFVDSTVAENNAQTLDASGGGIFVCATETLITGSTINGNIAGDRGGGLFIDSIAEIVNSTISGNGTLRNGGGIYHIGPQLRLTSDTIAFNAAIDGVGGGVYALDVVLTIANTIISNNVGGNCGLSPGATFGSLGTSIDSDGTCNLAGPTDFTGVDPLLLPLADNGGPTQTHAFADESLALDNGSDDECVEGDQRGQPRPQGLACDIGAVESPLAQPCAIVDLNGDGMVDDDDLQMVFDAEGSCVGCPEDIDGNGVVDVQDAVLVMTFFGPCPGLAVEGACCLANGSCIEVTFGACFLAGGQSWDADNDCGSVVCP